MAQGGIYDQLGGGFHRYSTERTWTVPHFEKMLYDNARQLVEVYAGSTPAPRSRSTAVVLRETLAFVTREMTRPRAASIRHSTTARRRAALRLDRRRAKRRCQSPRIWRLPKQVYGIGDKPNFEDKYQHSYPPQATGGRRPELKQSEEKNPGSPGASAKTTLRGTIPAATGPFRDTKILTAWNGQMIAGFAAAAALDNKAALAAAERRRRSVLDKFRRRTAGSCRTWHRAGKETEPGCTASSTTTPFSSTACCGCTPPPKRPSGSTPPSSSPTS